MTLPRKNSFLSLHFFWVRSVLLGKEAKIRVRIICQKLTEEQSMARRRKANRLARSQGYTSSKRNQKLLNWSIFITNVPENKISAEQVLTIYRVIPIPAIKVTDRQ